MNTPTDRELALQLLHTSLRPDCENQVADEIVRVAIALLDRPVQEAQS